MYNKRGQYRQLEIPDRLIPHCEKGGWCRSKFIRILVKLMQRRNIVNKTEILKIIIDDKANRNFYVLGHTMKKMEKDSYYCDKELMQSLVYDAMITENLEKHSGSIKEEKQ